MIEALLRQQLPTDWALQRVKDHAAVVNGFAFSSKLFTLGEGFPLVRIRDISAKETEVCYSGDPIPDALIDFGDILVGMDGDFHVARWRGGTALLNQRVCCVRPRDSVEARFLAYYLPIPLQAINEVTHATTVKHLSSNQIRDIRFPLPPLETQRAIADFLDAETARIDALIAAKEKLLALLAEKRRALVTQAVTRGLDPSVPMRDSGIPWLGKIPAHWEVAPLRFLVRFEGGSTPSKSNREFWNGDIPWVSPKDMKVDRICDSEDHVTDAALADTSLSIVPTGSVLLVVRGMILAHSVPVAVTTGPVTINQDMKALRCSERLDAEFLHAVIVGAKAWFLANTGESSHGTKKLDTDTIGRFRVPIPPNGEQRQIVSLIGRRIDEIDVIMDAVKTSSDLLRERREAVIAAAVTGQLDVEVA